MFWHRYCFVSYYLWKNCRTSTEKYMECFNLLNHLCDSVFQWYNSLFSLGPLSVLRTLLSLFSCLCLLIGLGDLKLLPSLLESNWFVITDISTEISGVAFLLSVPEEIFLIWISAVEICLGLNFLREFIWCSSAI